MPASYRRSLVVASLAAAAALAGPVGAQQTELTITGRVTSEAGAPVPGASVALIGTGLGALVRDDGTYTILVPPARVTGQTATLTARSIGYKPVSVPITLAGPTITHDFLLPANPLQLGEVVVTGAGTSSTAERIGTARTNVDAQTIVQANSPNVVEALSAKAPGVVINTQSGDPGASASIRIRGLNTIQGTGQPLFVVDGTPIYNNTVSTSGSLGSTVSPNRAADINPQDIENIEILKSGAAAAIYGARAGQGVVLITTKSGRPGQTRYSLSSTTRFDQVSKSVPLQTIFGQGSENASGVPQAAVCSTVNCQLTGSSYGPRVAAGTPVYDHSLELYNTGTLFDNNLTMSGGNDRTTFFLSGSYSANQGIFVGPNDYYNRATVRLKATQQLTSAFQVTGNIAYTDDRGGFIQKGSNTSGVNLAEWRSTPTFNNFVYLDSATGLHRSYRFPRPGPASTTQSRLYDNPLFVIYQQQNTQQVGRAFGNVGLAYDPGSWFSFHYNLGADYLSDERLETLPLTSSSYPQGQVIRGNIVQYQLDNTLTGDFNHTWRPGFDGKLTLGFNLNSRNFRQNFVTGQNLIAPAPFTLTNTLNYTPDDFQSLIHGEAYFGQAQQTFFDQFTLTGTLRNDGFSTFGASDRRHWFPALTGAWTFTNVFNPHNFFSSGKLRAAYGQTGTEPGVYLTNGYFSGGFFTSSYGDQLLASQAGRGGLYTGTRKQQNNLKPEVTTEFESGIDAGFLNDRADASFTYYNRKSTDVIFDLPLAPTTGFTVQANNAATLRNEGVEATLNLHPIQRASFGWDLGFQYARNRNRVLELRGADKVDLPTGGYFTGTLVSAVPGNPIGVFYSYDFARCRYGQPNKVALETGTAPVDINAVCQAAKAPNGALYIGADGYPVEDPLQRVTGNPNPDWTGAIHTNLRFGKISVGGLLDIHRGGQVWNGTKGALYNFGTHADTRVRYDSVVFGANASGKNYQLYLPGSANRNTYPVVGPGVGTPVVLGQSWFQNLGSGFGDVSSQFLEDGSFVKLREISLSYTVDRPFVRRLFGITSIDLRVAGRNLKTWTNYTGVDPETNLGGAEVAALGIDYFNNPQTRSFVFTIGLNR